MSVTNSGTPLAEQENEILDGGAQGSDGDLDPFEIPVKPPLEALQRWRRATLALNATRRFRYTANVEARLQRSVAAKRFRVATRTITAMNRFKEAVGSAKDLQALESSIGFFFTPEQLSDLVGEGDVKSLDAVHGVKGLAKGLKTDLEKGIEGSEDDLSKRGSTFGTNTHPQKPGKSFFYFVWEACQDTTLIILAIAAAVSLGVGIGTEGSSGWYDGAGIAFAIALCVVVTAVSDYRQAIQFRNLENEKDKIYLQVTRSARREKVLIFDLVVGDVVHLNIGDQVPADGAMITGHGLTIDESSMTGESHPMHKDAKKPFLLAGTKVSDGFGSMLVTGVGMHTEWGRVMATLSEDTDEETPLQVRLNGTATAIGKLGLSVAVFTFVVLIIRFLATVDYSNFGGEDGKRIVEYFAIAVTIVVVAIPEGLPLAVTLTLAYSMRKMMNDNSLVRHLAACETMGSATTICSDKTGTLTLNQMSVVDSWGAGHKRDPSAMTSQVSKEVLDILLEGIAQNTNGSVFLGKEGKPEVVASPTETAVLSWGLEIGLAFEATRAKASIVQVEPFNSAKKRMGIAIRHPNDQVRVHWKGASEIVLAMCTSYIDETGQIHPLTDPVREELKGTIESMASASLRTLCLAYRELGAGEAPAGSAEGSDWKIPENDLVCLAIVGIKDPCRPGVPEAVATCQRAGVMVRMVTGDNVVTAKAIARECGILTEDGLAIEGKDFRVMTPEEQMQILPRVQVMARSSPSDKHTLVKRLREMGEVVAVTGDGTNDAPALHEADVGLAMGISGTEVAKGASDIVILDDNFASIVKVVRWGRSVYVNIQKFIQFQLTVNVVALCLNFVSAIISGEAPLTAVQLLWVNLIMDTLGALALATEPPTDDLLERPPVGRRAPLITNIMYRNIAGQAIYQLIILFVLNYAGMGILSIDEGYKGPNDQYSEGELTKLTIIFNSFVFCQLFNEINARRPESFNVFSGILKNPLFICIIILTTGFQAIIVEFLGKFATTTAIKWWAWILSIVLGSLSIPVALLVKLIPVPKKPYAETRYLRWLFRRKKRKSRSLLADVPAPSNPMERAADIQAGFSDIGPQEALEAKKAS